MTIGELIEQLEEFDPNTRIKLGLQPNYPMIGSIQNICIERDENDNEKTLWIACSGNQNYGCPTEIWENDCINS